MRIRVKRCDVCASKLDKDGACTWEGCPKSPAYNQPEIKVDEKPAKKSKDEKEKL